MVGLKAFVNSRRLAKCIYDEAANRNLQGNRYVPEGHYWPQSLAMCDRTLCPAVLTESLFYDNKGDLAILKSAEGKRAHRAGPRRRHNQLPQRMKQLILILIPLLALISCRTAKQTISTAPVILAEHDENS